MMTRSICVLCGLLAPSLWAQDHPRTSCLQDSEIGGLEQPINLAAMNFVGALLDDDSATALSYVSTELRRNLTPAELTGKIGAIRQFDPTNARVEHTYLIQVGEPPEGRVVCAAQRLEPNQWISLSAAKVPEQAHVLLSAHTPNNRLAFTIWMVPEDGNWRVRGFWFNVAKLADQGPAELWEKAREQNQRGHRFNAALLYVSALQLVNRGPDFQMGITNAIREEMTHLEAPHEIQGPSPFSWQDGDKSWKILSVGPLAVGGKIYIAISHEVPQIQTDHQVDDWNRELLAYFKNRFPEYSDAFAGVVIRAHERGTSRGFGTVEGLRR